MLDTLDEIPVCVGYRLHGQPITEMPATRDGFDKIETVYQKLPGWKTSTTAVTRYADLPKLAKDYLSYLAELVGVEVGCVSVGPDRDQTMFLPGSRMEKLLGS